MEFPYGETNMALVVAAVVAILMVGLTLWVVHRIIRHVRGVQQTLEWLTYRKPE